jgi:hypothetical protein
LFSECDNMSQQQTAPPLGRLPTRMVKNDSESPSAALISHWSAHHVAYFLS